MNIPLLKLELRKNRLSAASVAASFLVTLPVSRLVAGTTGMEPAKALEAILLGWLFLGAPFAAALIGSSAGAQTGSRDAREAEGLLPVSPRRRAAASVLAAALLLAAVAALLLATAWLNGALAFDLAPRDQVMTWARPFWAQAPVASLLLFTLADALLGCWLLSYMIGHGIAGGLLGLMLTASALLIAGVGCGLQIIHGDWGVRVLPTLAWLAAGSVAAKLAAAARAAAWRERSARLGAAGAAALAVLVLFGPLSAAVAVERTYAAFVRRLRVSDPPVNFHYQAWYEKTPASPAALSATGREATVYNPRGGLYAAGAGGVRVLIPEERRGPLDLVLRPFEGAMITFAERDERGVLWAHRRVEPKKELWREENGGMRMARRSDSSAWPYLDRYGRRLLVPYWTGKETYYADVEDYARLGDLAPRDRSHVAATAHGQGLPRMAVVGCAPAGDCLKLGATTWRLPGPALSHAIAYPHWVAGKPVYLIPVSTKGGLVAALCREGGRVETAWRLRDKNDGFYGLPDGTLYAFEPGDSLVIVDAGGGISRLRYAGLRPAGAALESKPSLVRRQGGRSWLVWGDVLLEAGDDGRLVSLRALPHVAEFRVTDGGLLLDDGRTLRFLAWDGALRRVEPPR